MHAYVHMHAVGPPSRFSPKQASLLLTLNLTEQLLPLCQATIYKQEVAVHDLALSTGLSTACMDWAVECFSHLTFCCTSGRGSACGSCHVARQFGRYCGPHTSHASQRTHPHQLRGVGGHPPPGQQGRLRIIFLQQPPSHLGKPCQEVQLCDHCCVSALLALGLFAGLRGTPVKIAGSLSKIHCFPWLWCASGLK